MKFFMIGDSWGCGAYEIINDDFKLIPESGVASFLSQAGHTVRNESVGGAGNFGQLRHANHLLETEGNDYDYIIWIHTEPIRDAIQIIVEDPIDGPIQFPDFDTTDFFVAMKYINEQNYKYAQQMYTDHQVPFVVVGGCSAIDTSINNYSFAEIKIVSWMNELLKLDSPLSVNCYPDRIYRFLTCRGRQINKSQIIDEIENMYKLETAMKTHPEFPDNLHPSSECYEKLAHRILGMIDAGI